LLARVKAFGRRVGTPISERHAEYVTNGLSDASVAAYNRAHLVLEEYARKSGEKLWQPSPHFFFNFAATNCISRPGAVKLSGMAWRWLFLSVGATPPPPQTIRLVISYAFAMARRQGKIGSKPALSVVGVWQALKKRLAVAADECDRTGDGQLSVSARFIRARDACMSLSAVYAFMRSSDVARVVEDSVVVGDDSVSFRAARTKELSRVSRSDARTAAMWLGRVSDDDVVCPVKWFRRFQALRSELGFGADQRQYFCAVNGDVITSSTVAQVLRGLVMDVEDARASGKLATPHALRGSMSSAALDMGVTLDDVLRQGRWKQASTFWHYYDRRGLVGIQLPPDGGCRLVEWPARLAQVVRESFTGSAARRFR
jgi:hypothetical protein